MILVVVSGGSWSLLVACVVVVVVGCCWWLLGLTDVKDSVSWLWWSILVEVDDSCSVWLLFVKTLF